MESLYTVRHADHYPDDYMQAWQEMPLDYQPYEAHCAKGGHLDDSERRARGEAPLYTGPRYGQAIRTDITNPGYRCRAVYRIQSSEQVYGYEPGYWVYDGGKLIEVDAWHADPANRQTEPPPPPPPPPVVSEHSALVLEMHAAARVAADAREVLDAMEADPAYADLLFAAWDRAHLAGQERYRTLTAYQNARKWQEVRVMVR